MRHISLPFPTLMSGFVAVLVGYASSAAIIWQAATAAGATPDQIAGWMTMLGIAMGASSLILSCWYRIPVLTAWSTPGAALLATSLHGLTINDAIGVFVFANLLIVLCGVTGLFARLMQIIPHSLAAAMLAGILLRFGLDAFANLQGHLVLTGTMLACWVIARRIAPRYAIVFTLVAGLVICAMTGSINTRHIDTHFVIPQWVTPHFSLSALLGVGVPFFLVTMASQNAPGVATMKASGYHLPVSLLMVVTGGLSLLLSPFGVFSVCIAAITAAICQSPEAHPDAQQRWKASATAGVFYLLAGLSGATITSLMAAVPEAWIQTLAGLALLGTISGSLVQALNIPHQRDAAIITFLITASGVTLGGVGSAFWGLVAGGVCYACLAPKARIAEGVQP